MQHFANFGYVKQQNKQLKNYIHSATMGSNATPHQIAGNTGWMGANQFKESTDPDLLRSYRKVIKENSKDPLTKRLGEDYISVRKSPVENLDLSLLKKDWTDVRKTNDYTASPTGYLGFRTDPFKGYGGMMEESVPSEAINSIRLKPPEPVYTKNYISRVSGRTLKN